MKLNKCWGPYLQADLYLIRNQVLGTQIIS